VIPYHGCQYSGQGGHYESWFLRANAPDAPRAFWIRYTLFIPADGKRAAMGELWAIWFDGDRQQVTAVKEEYPLADCQFDDHTMSVQLAAAHLQSHALNGKAEHGGNRLSWTLNYDDGQAPVLFLPEALYPRKLPRAKSVVSRPMVRFTGRISVNGEEHLIDGWSGSENHNWGSQHTDQYAWGQVAGFDNAPDAFLECITARVRIGPVPSPWLTIACLRLDGKDYSFNRIGEALRARGKYRFFDWSFRTRSGGDTLNVHIEAPAQHFTGLTYFNPPGGSKTCLNSKIARCTAELVSANGEHRTLTSAHGAAFEILTDRTDHGVPVAV
jgi:hypothetical protein